MTVNSSTARVTYAGDGTATAFTVPFAFLADSHLSVVLRTAEGTETAWTDGVEYSVSGAGVPTGGTVTVATAPTDYRPQTGETLTILRAVPLTQETDFTEGDPLPAETLERALDRLTMMIQQLDELLDRAPKFSKTSGITDVDFPDPSASQVVAWNTAGDALVNVNAYSLSNVDLVLSGFGKELVAEATAADARAKLGTPLVGGNVLTPHEGLVCKWVSATTVDIDAAAILLKTSGGDGYAAASVNLTVDITASGANGLDSGVEANSTWYALWVVYNGTTVAGLLSTSFTSPTLPVGYTHMGLVGAVYNNSSGNFVEFFQRGDFVGMKTTGFLTNGTATTFATVDLTTAVPTTARSVLLSGYLNTASGIAAVNGVIAPDGSGNTPIYTSSGIYKENISTAGFTAPFVEIPLSMVQSIKYFVSGVNAQLTLAAQGFRY